MALLTSSITSIVDVISYVLIAFVAVSLVVSCIMIGTITHISVLERTKEIGIIRASALPSGISLRYLMREPLLSASVPDCLAVLLTIPINAILQGILGAETLTVSLSIVSALILIALSMVITIIGGLLPVKKDPVIALRTE